MICGRMLKRIFIRLLGIFLILRNLKSNLEKIDLLAAARCNMFSHVLVSYMTDMKQFAQKTMGAFETISKALDQKPKYDFCVLKELTQNEIVQEEVSNASNLSFDKDQNLFFALDFEDADNTNKVNPQTEEVADDFSLLHLYKNDVIDLITDQNPAENNAIEENTNEHGENDTNQLWSKVFGSNGPTASNMLSAVKCDLKQKPIHSAKNSKQNPWIELFAELDPLANLEAFDMKLSGSRKNFQQT